MLKNTKTVKISDEITIGADSKLCIIAGPCVAESLDILFETCEFLKETTLKFGFNYIFKTSFDKANRTSIKGYRGPGLDKGLEMILEVKKRYNVLVLTDVHEEYQIKPLSEVVDILQIPAFLCRQTDFIINVSKSAKCVNIKKGQFVAPNDAYHIIEKVLSTGNENVFITERGYTFGYNNLVFDPRSLHIMRKFGYPVVFDATHSVQLPSINSCSSGGMRELVLPYARSAYALGIDGLFLEVHPNPEKALCDGANMIDFSMFTELLTQISLLGDKIYSKI